MSRISRSTILALTCSGGVFAITCAVGGGATRTLIGPDAERMRLRAERDRLAAFSPGALRSLREQLTARPDQREGPFPVDPKWVESASIATRGSATARTYMRESPRWAEVLAFADGLESRDDLAGFELHSQGTRSRRQLARVTFTVGGEWGTARRPGDATFPVAVESAPPRKAVTSPALRLPSASGDRPGVR